MKRVLLGLFLSTLSWGASAFNLDDLQTQLRAAPVVQGHFVQEKHLRSLPQPLTSRGDFTLATGRGLLWLLRSPIVQDIRITPKGISKRDENGVWKALAQQTSGGRENRLFLSVLEGDTQGLRDTFEMELSGNAEHWRIVMTPRSALLRQIFKEIHIDGGKLVERIELQETQGDSTVMRMIDARAIDALSAEDERAFAN